MAEGGGSGGAKVLRGFFIAVLIVAVIILLSVFGRNVANSGQNLFDYVSSRFPTDGDQQAAVIGYLVIAGLLGILFSRAGHFTAYGVAIGLGSLLWGLFWEGFSPLGMDPWAAGMGLGDMPPADVFLWAVVAVVVITVVFVPLELIEMARTRRRPASLD